LAEVGSEHPTNARKHAKTAPRNATEIIDNKGLCVWIIFSLIPLTKISSAMIPLWKIAAG
jgi:hypothetical protein